MNSKDRPNFILFMTDQQRGDCLSIAGHPVLLTPVMDSIGGGGTHFSRAYTTCPSCVPARRCLLAGRFPFGNQMVGMTHTPWDPETTMPRELLAAGYQTAIVGRNMHQYRPDGFYGFEYVAEDYHTYLEAGQPVGGGGLRGHGVSSNGWTARPWHLADHLHHSHWVVNEALRKAASAASAITCAACLISPESSVCWTASGSKSCATSQCAAFRCSALRVS